MRSNIDTFGNKIFSELTCKVIGCAIEVHRNLGPGLLESANQQALEYELKINGVDYKSQIALPMSYKSATLDGAYRLDLLVDSCLVVELKVVDEFAPVHSAQILTYMKLAEAPVGLLFNFKVKYLKQGIRRFVL